MRTRAAILLCLAALLPAAALAQTTGITVTETSTASAGGLNDQQINVVECQGLAADSLSLSWTVGGTPDATWSKFRIEANATNDCTTGTTVQLATDVPVAAGGSATGTVSGIDVRSKIITPLALTACSGNTTVNIAICVSVLDTGGTKVGGASATASITLDPTIPSIPEGVSASPGEAGLNVSWSAGTGGAATASSYTATATPVSPDANHQGCNAGGSAGSCSVSNDTSCRIGGLTNNACYDVTVVAFSAVNNRSAASAAVVGIPLPVLDFWRLYKGNGGIDNGGCGQGAAGLLALLSLAPFMPRRRRRAP